MGFFDDYQAALETYITDYVTPEIFEITYDDGNALNRGERGRFRVRIHNAGPVRLDALTIRVRGLNGMQVANNGAASVFDDDFTSVVGQFPLINAHNGNPNVQENEGSGFQFEAPDRRQGVQDLIEVSIVDWNADLVHLHNGHSDGEASVVDIYRDRVRAA